MARDPVVVDACSALNLIASGFLGEIIEAAKIQLVALPEVIEEAKYLLGEMDEEGNRERTAIDWSALLAQGHFSSRMFPDEALSSFIDLAGELTDVDARCVALARHLRVGLVSDDGKVRRVFSVSSRGLPLKSTVSLIRQAANLLSLDRGNLRSIFARVRDRARFEPSRRDPDYAWYVEQVSS